MFIYSFMKAILTGFFPFTVLKQDYQYVLLNFSKGSPL